MISSVILIDSNLDDQKYTKFIKELNSIGSLRVRLCKNVNKAITLLTYIEFEEIKVIISDKLYDEFMNKFKQNIINLCVAPKIVIFTDKKEKFIKRMKYYQNNNIILYNFFGIVDSFDEIKKFVKNEFKSKISKRSKDAKLAFEYIDKKEKLFLPLFFKVLIDIVSNDNMEEYTTSLYNKYSNQSEDIKNLLGSIESIKNIPVETLAKYYARLYTFESNFYKDLNNDLLSNKKEKIILYLPYIKTLYEGVKLKSLPLATDNILYRGAKLSNDEIKKIKNFLEKKIEGLPCSIIFSRTFLSFSKDPSIAESYLSLNNTDKNVSKVMFILEKDDENVEYNLSTHSDIEKISYYPDEREVLFFPFSSFEIKDMNIINIGKEKGYEVKLLYLGKYLEDIENDKDITMNEYKIPDSEFKRQLTEFGLIKKEKIENINTKKLFNVYKQYEEEINNFIIGEIDIGQEDISKNIQIVNSFENVKKIKSKFMNYESDDWKYENEEELKENIEIKINGKKIDFSYYHKFEKEGTYKIVFSFKKKLTKTNYLFYNCMKFISLDFSNFNTQNVDNMRYMFYNCKKLTNLDLTNFNTQNVTDMKDMFYGCNSLKKKNIITNDNKILNNI